VNGRGEEEVGWLVDLLKKRVIECDIVDWLTGDIDTY
jgi:hypothetical protein